MKTKLQSTQDRIDLSEPLIKNIGSRQEINQDSKSEIYKNKYKGTELKCLRWKTSKGEYLYYCFP